MPGEVKLKPCPFCGCEAELVRYGNSRMSTQYQCTQCHCFLETSEAFNYGEQWNRRAPEPREDPFSELRNDALVSCTIKDGERVTIEIRLDNLHRDAAPDVSANIVASELECYLRQAGISLRVDRAPESGTSVLYGMCFDGTEETAPIKGSSVVLIKGGHEYFVRASENRKCWLFDYKVTDYLLVEIGDIFIYLADIPIYMRRGIALSMPPEGME